MRSIKIFSSLLLVSATFFLNAANRVVCAQSKTAEGNQNFDATHVPKDALAVAILAPTQLFESPSFQLLPIEPLRVLGKEQLGMDPLDIEEIRAVVSLNPQTMQPQFGAMLRLNGNVDLDKLVTAFGGPGDSVKIRSLAAYPIDGPPGAVVARVDERTIYLGMGDYLPAMLDAQGGDGALPRLLETMPRRAGLSLALTMDQIGPMVSGIAMQQSAQLAPALQPLAQIPALTDALSLNVQFDGQTAIADLTFVAKDDIASERIHAILSDGLVATRDLGVAEIARSVSGSGQSSDMQQAIETYANRVADMLVDTLTPDRKGNHVTIEMESEVGLATVGILGGMLLPAVQSARIASGRMSASNNMKQIMLAMHNYHSAYKQLPVSAIMDDDGKPLLSWRVAILPFIEEQELYEQFHLDEPWDSEHNLPLSKKLPAVYRPPGKRLPPGTTTYQAFVGKGLAMEPLKVMRFRDILDGLSNTVLIVETNDEAAVPWSKPVDLEIDMDKPLANLGNARQGGFHVGLGDGAVVFITKNIDPDLFKGLMTRAGREVIRDAF